MTREYENETHPATFRDECEPGTQESSCVPSALKHVGLAIVAAGHGIIALVILFCVFAVMRLFGAV